MTNAQITGYFLQDEIPKVTYKGTTPLTPVRIEKDRGGRIWARSNSSGIGDWKCLLKDLNIHLHRLEDVDFGDEFCSDIQKEIIDGTMSDFRLPIAFVEHCWKNNICLVPSEQAGNNIKFID